MQKLFFSSKFLLVGPSPGYNRSEIRGPPVVRQTGEASSLIMLVLLEEDGLQITIFLKASAITIIITCLVVVAVIAVAIIAIQILIHIRLIIGIEIR